MKKRYANLVILSWTLSTGLLIMTSIITVGIFMNLSFVKIIENLLTFLFVALIGIIFTKLLFIFLRKSEMYDTEHGRELVAKLIGSMLLLILIWGFFCLFSMFFTLFIVTLLIYNFWLISNNGEAYISSTEFESLSFLMIGLIIFSYYGLIYLRKSTKLAYNLNELPDTLRKYVKLGVNIPYYFFGMITLMILINSPLVLIGSTLYYYFTSIKDPFIMFFIINSLLLTLYSLILTIFMRKYKKNTFKLLELDKLSN